MIAFISIKFWQLIADCTTGTRERCEDLRPDFPVAIYLMPLGIVGSRQVYHSIWLLPPAYPCAGFSSHIPIRKNIYLFRISNINDIFFGVELPDENLSVGFSSHYRSITRGYHVKIFCPVFSDSVSIMIGNSLVRKLANISYLSFIW